MRKSQYSLPLRTSTSASGEDIQPVLQEACTSPPQQSQSNASAGGRFSTRVSVRAGTRDTSPLDWQRSHPLPSPQLASSLGARNSPSPTPLLLTSSDRPLHHQQHAWEVQQPTQQTQHVLSAQRLRQCREATSKSHDRDQEAQRQQGTKYQNNVIVETQRQFFRVSVPQNNVTQPAFRRAFHQGLCENCFSYKPEEICRNCAFCKSTCCQCSDSSVNDAKTEEEKRSS